MISIIICSKHADTPPELEMNIHKTIGTAYEIVHIDNSAGKFGICQAYNVGVEKAKGDILCFMHEDVVFYSPKWGKRVEVYMSHPEVGMLGVAGSQLVPSRGDWRFLDGRLKMQCLIQGLISPDGIYYTGQIRWKILRQLYQVAILDGLWFCIRKELFRAIRFDEENFPRFHLYDSDISMQVNDIGLGTYVCDDIILEHASDGVFINGFKEGAERFVDKWKAYLPLVRGAAIGLSREEIETETEKGLLLYQRRMEMDTVIAEYRTGGTARLGLSEKKWKIIRLREFRCIKQGVKSSIPMGKAWNAVWAYPWKYWRLKAKLLCKFMYYRILLRPFKKNRLNQITGDK